MDTSSFRKLTLPLAVASLALPAFLGSAAAVEPEILVGFRGPEPYPDGVGRYIWFPTTRTETDWQDNLDLSQIVDWGWEGIQQFFLADLNGDGVDDKVMYQLAGSPAVAQVIATYTTTNPTSFTTADFNSPNGSLQIPYGWIPQDGKSLVFGDIDMDGIDDCGIVIPGNALDTGSAPIIGDGVATALYWGCWYSNGNIGISNPGSGDFSGWNPFGVVGEDQPMLGDFNGDGVDDRLLFRADPAGDGSQPPQVFVDYSVATGGWGDGAVDITLTIGINGDKLQISDINGDGLDDLVLYARPNPEDGNLQDLFGYYNDGAGFANLDGAAPDIQDLWGIGDGVLFAQLTPSSITDPGGTEFAITEILLNSDGSIELTFDTTEENIYEVYGSTDMDFPNGPYLGDVTGGPGFLTINIPASTLDTEFGSVRPKVFLRIESF